MPRKSQIISKAKAAGVKTANQQQVQALNQVYHNVLGLTDQPKYRHDAVALAKTAYEIMDARHRVAQDVGGEALARYEQAMTIARNVQSTGMTSAKYTYIAKLLDQAWKVAKKEMGSGKAAGMKGASSTAVVAFQEQIRPALRQALANPKNAKQAIFGLKNKWVQIMQQYPDVAAVDNSKYLLGLLKPGALQYGSSPTDVSQYINAIESTLTMIQRQLRIHNKAKGQAMPTKAQIIRHAKAMGVPRKGGPRDLMGPIAALVKQAKALAAKGRNSAGHPAASVYNKQEIYALGTQARALMAQAQNLPGDKYGYKQSVINQLATAAGNANDSVQGFGQRGDTAHDIAQDCYFIASNLESAYGDLKTMQRYAINP